MGRVLDAFWRAAAYCLHPRVIALSLVPLLLTAALAWGLGYFFWESAVDSVRATLDSWKLIDSLLGWLSFVGASDFRAALAPMIVLALALPVLVVFSLFVVALLMTPALVRLVAARRFRALEKKQGGSAWWKSLGWSVWHCFLACVLLLLSMPFWLIPPLVLILPPLICGWLGYRIFAFDVLAEHASVEERQQLMKEHRAPLLGLGVITGYLGAAPAAIWALSVMAVVLAPLLILVSVWLYVLVFAFSTLWFTHYSLSALAELRARVPAAVVVDMAEEAVQ
ncbi:MAG: EI24 domain-containing protein [Paucibacter sp.]|nr:EI24 domain-containing protein [Roseateles sp.]